MEVNMPLVTIKIIEGRTIEQKRGMTKDVTEAIVKNIGCPTAAVQIDIVELKPENIAQGGSLFSDKPPV
jgi:4-oxalocrotonate tautomerase